MTNAPAFIGFGEVAYFMSQGLGEEGVSGFRAYDPAAAGERPTAITIRNRMAEVGVTRAYSVEELLQDATLVMSAVPAKFNADVANSVLPYMRKEILYIDLTTCAPSVKEQLASAFGNKGFRYVDAAMLGALPTERHKVPMCCSGYGANDWVELATSWKMKAQLIEGPAGLGSKVKLTRSIFMKGLQAVTEESFLLAHKLGLEEMLLQSLAGSFSKEPIEKMIPRFMCATAVHAERRKHEVEDSIALMEEIGITPAVSKGVAERMGRTAGMNLREELGGVPPENLQTLYQLWEKKHYS